ncbi:MAG: response regulator [SAR324 cluster bacterium]|nr:response regulator [SAR324 cluster bacterium]
MPASPEIRILIVDDNEQMRILLRTILEHANFFNITEAENGEAAWELLKSEPFDLVITDWNMQQMNGLKLLERIRETAQTHDIPVIMITIHTEKQFVNKAFKAGVNNYITKPFDRELVIKKIHMVFDRSSAPSSDE